MKQTHHCHKNSHISTPHLSLPSTPSIGIQPFKTPDEFFPLMLKKNKKKLKNVNFFVHKIVNCAFINV